MLFCEEGRAISSDCDFATVRCGLRLTHRVAATAAAQVELIRRGHFFGEIAFIAQARAGPPRALAARPPAASLFAAC